MKIGSTLTLLGFLAVGCVLLMGPVGGARAADEWFMLAEKPIKSVDQGVDIKSQGNRWKKDVKQVKFSVEGADVEITKVVLKWNNRPDQTLTDVGVIKAGGQSTPKDAPLRKAQLSGVVVTYKIVGDAQAATLKVWGYD